MRPSLGVVVPTLNERDELPRLFARLFDAPDAPEAVCVSDGGSTDGTQDFARARGVRLVVGTAGRGVQLARGAEQLNTELLLFLHADCSPEPGALDVLREELRGRHELVALGMRQRILAAGWFYRLVERAADRRVRAGMVFGDSGLTVRRRPYEEAGGFSNQPLFEDVDLSERLRRLGRIELSAARVEVSARRWQVEGPLRRTVRNWMLRSAYGLGVAPERLVRHYRPGAHAAPGFEETS